jgi:hypothetical protein
VPIVHAYRPVLAKLFHDRVELEAEGAIVASFRRSYRVGELVLDPMHVLPLLEKKHRAVDEASALKGFHLPAVFHELRTRMRPLTRKPDQEWISVLRLLEQHALHEVEAAVAEAIARGTPRLSTVSQLLRQHGEPMTCVAPALVKRPDLAALTIEAPHLDRYDVLTAEASR